MKLLITLLLLATTTLHAKDINYSDFLLKEHEKNAKDFKYNRYENFISGVGAFVLGNVGYLLSDGSVVKLSYAGIQTIGIINIGQGIYKLNATTPEKKFAGIMAEKSRSTYTKDALAKDLLELYAQEQRAKRLSLFYSSTFLSIQYILNASVYESPGKLKSVYLFLGGVNGIIATYSAFFKGSYESLYYGKELDLAPFAYEIAGVVAPGLIISMSF